MDIQKHPLDFFPEMVAGLAKPGVQLLEQMTPDRMHQIHMIIGLAGESGELTEAAHSYSNGGVNHNLYLKHMVEELGDIEFYFEGLAQSYGLHAHTIEPVEMEQAIVTVVVGDVVDAVKKIAIYNKPDNEQNRAPVLAAMGKLRYCLDSIYRGIGIDREDAIAHNVSKLGKRYKGHQYSDQQAHDRADKPEGE